MSTGVYPASAYTELLKYVQSLFGIGNGDMTPGQWLGWRVQIKKLFDLNFTIAEIKSAIAEAQNWRLWPQQTRFWHRVKDVLLARRKEAERRNPVVLSQPQSIGAILKAREEPV